MPDNDSRQRPMRHSLHLTILLGLTIFAITLVASGVGAIVNHLQVACLFVFAVWTVPSLLLLVLPRIDIGAPGKLHTYTTARDSLRPGFMRVFLCWLVVPMILGGVLLNTMQHIQFGGFFGEARIYGTIAWLKTAAIAFGQAMIIVVGMGALMRGLIEPIALLATAIAPARAATIRRRAEIAWSLLYYVGIPLAVLVRYSA